MSRLAKLGVTLVVMSVAGWSAVKLIADHPATEGRITLARLRWGSDLRGYGRGFSSAWNHDYPRAEQHLSMIIKDITFADIRTEGDVVLKLDDPALFNYPLTIMWEPGFWNLTDREAESFRAYLLKGGFAIFEDFDGPEQWSVFESQMRRVLPEGHLVRLDKSHPIFDSFFRIKDIDAILHPMSGLKPSYYGIFEDNNPSRRCSVSSHLLLRDEVLECPDRGFGLTANRKQHPRAIG